MRLAIALAIATVATPTSAAIKVACTGTSAMQGLGSTAGHHVPDEMGKALGPAYEVRNFGAEGTTAIRSTGSAYWDTSQMKAALAYNPDVVVFWFGGNDSFQAVWDAHKSEFRPDYTNLVRAFQSLPSHPKTFLVRLWVFVDTPVQKTVIDREILPIIDQMAIDTSSTLIDYRKAFETHPEYFPDGMHPNDTGTLAIGKLFADVVSMTLAAGDGGIGSDASIMDAGDGGLDGSGGSTADTSDAISMNDVGHESAVADVDASGAGGSGSSGTGAGGASGARGIMPAPGANASPEGCGCRVGRADGGRLGGALAAMLLGLCLVRRRARAQIAARF